MGREPFRPGDGPPESRKDRPGSGREGTLAVTEAPRREGPEGLERLRRAIRDFRDLAQYTSSYVYCAKGVPTFAASAAGSYRRGSLRRGLPSPESRCGRRRETL